MSVSLHNAPYLAASGDPLATDAERDDQTETLSTDNTAEEDTLGGKWIEDAARMDGKAVVAYVVSGSELSDREGFVNDKENHRAYIYNADGLREWARTINEDNENYSGYTIEIMNDIDLEGEWSPIMAGTTSGVENTEDTLLGSIKPDDGKGATLIDGNGHIINNMVVQESLNVSSEFTAVGFIGELGAFADLTIKDITFENAHVSTVDGDNPSTTEYQSYAGVLIGHGDSCEYGDVSNDKLTFENVNILNSVITSGSRSGSCAGAIIGYNSGDTLFQNCYVENTFVGGYNASTAILFGMGNAKVVVEDCLAKGVKLYTDGLNWTCAMSKDQLWVARTYSSPERVTVSSSEANDCDVVYPVYFHIGNQIIKKYVPVNKPLSDFEEEWFGGIFEVGSGKHIEWGDGTNTVIQITADKTGSDMYPYGKQSLVNDESYETQDTDQVDNPLTHGAIDLYAKNAPTDPVNPDVPEWEKSKSKTATNLDENYESRVTLSLPAAQETLESDVVFVLDKSTSADVEDQAIEMLNDLNTQLKKTDAAIKVGVVIFNQKANSVLGLTELNDGSINDIQTAIKTEIKDGTNTHAGLLAGKAMLDADTNVDANRKYMIFISDGNTYMYGEDPTVATYYWMNDGSPYYSKDNYAWKFKYGNGNAAPEDWNQWIGEIGNIIASGEPANTEIGYGQTPSTGIPADELDIGQYTTNVDRALYYSYQVYHEALQEGYHCYALNATETKSSYEWASGFMDYLANGKEVSFDEIQNDIYYLLDAGSTVVDEIGYGDDYDFAFVKPEEMVLTVSGQKQEMTRIGDNHWGFGERLENGNYPYEVTYYADGSDEADGEHFVWAINVPVTNFAPVELTYTVKLTNPHTEAGTYGRYDEDGSENYSGLYTNKDATLNPVDSNGYKGDSEKFQKPTVSYTVNGSSSTPAEWEISKSKTATELNENRESTVTLGLPSAEKAIDTDIVFVVDKSSSAENAVASLKNMIDDLAQETADLEASAVKVGVVLFDGKVDSPTNGLLPLKGNENAIKDALDIKYGSGTNVQGGILKGMQILDEDTSVPNENKYLVLITDGISHIWNENDDPNGRQMTSYVEVAPDNIHSVWAGPNSYFYYRNKDTAWTFDELMALDVENTNGWNNDVPYTGTDSYPLDEWNGPYVTIEDYDSSIFTLEKGIYKAAQAYREASTKYKTISVYWETEGYPIASQFMEGIGATRIEKGDTVQIAETFAEIEDRILYLLDAGSRVVDVIGEGTSNLGDPYDFTFVNDISRMNLTVDGVALDKKEIESVDGVSYSYGFGDRGDGTYRFVVTYYPNGTQDTDGEHFVWEINEAISNFAPVQFQYVVRLTTAPTAGGTHGQYDGNGEHNYSGLLTNKEATLYPVDSNGTTYPSENFPKPTVSYTVDNGGDTPVDPTPGGSSGGGSSSGSGSSGGGAYTPSGGPGVTINPEEVPLAPLPDTSTTTTIGENEVPLSPLPKTGETARRGWAVMMLSGALMALVAVLSRKREEER